MIGRALQRITRFLAEDYQYLSTARFIEDKFREDRRAVPISVDKDYLLEVRRFWAQYLPVRSYPHALYTALNGIRDVRYVPDLLFYAIIEPTFNRLGFAAAIDDKSYYPERFYGASQPATVVRGISGTLLDDEFEFHTVRSAFTRARDHAELVIKPSIGEMGGNLVTFFEPARLSEVEFASLLKRYRGNFVIQEVVQQHPSMRVFNPTSVNTVRIMTLLADNDVVPLSAVLRIGCAGARVDNVGKGGLFCGLTESGVTKAVAYDTAYHPSRSLTDGTPIGGIPVPAFADALEMVKALHRRHAHFRLISWDVAVSAEGTPTVIEFNLARQDIDFHQATNGPLFGERTDAILKEVFAVAERRTLVRLLRSVSRIAPVA